VLPSMAGALFAGVRLAIIAGWGCVMLVEWFGSNQGVGFRARLWYDASNFNGLMGWAIIIIAVVITIDRGIIERLDRRAHRWRARISGFGVSSGQSG
jgi:ABC-type nitrate/sulfonate/bicarbonate transport system permease component